ncbi:class I SAM-dependent methyltransferase family protein [Candidatus Woesearchaeota archaeon]|nr:class I SAM-dependent methyltransferase family protein [Candidatus Woesearchaeota archaeon]
MKCIKVPKKEAQKVKEMLMAKKLFALGYAPVAGRTYIYFPVNKEVKGYTLVEKEIIPVKKEELDFSSYDQIGDIVIVGEDVELVEAKKLLKRPNVKVVLRKKGIHHGEFRTQDLEFLAGEKRKETIYIEHGLRMKLDVEQCYFTPRLGTERMRIAELVQPGEKVLVLFSGVAPYPLVLAKYSQASLIFAVEKNPVAHQYALENCKKYMSVVLYNMDVKEFSYPEKFDRIIMPHPSAAQEFLPVALKHLKKNGVIHFYTFAADTEIPEKPVGLIRTKVPTFRVLSVIKCGQYAPKKYRVCVDFTV